MIRVLFLLVLTSGWLSAAPVCEYEENQFRVTLDGKTFEQRVSPGFWDPSIYCGDKLMALYDGFDLIVFRVATKTFHIELVNDGYFGSQLRGNEELLGLYDGKYLTIFDGQNFSQLAVKSNFYRSHLLVSSKVLTLYDGEEVHFYEKTRGIKTYSANPLYIYSEAVAYEQLALLYDGAEIHLYDGMLGETTRETAAPRAIFFEAAVGKNRALIYDGRSLFTYCSGKGFSKSDASPSIFVSSGYDAGLDRLWMRIQGVTYELKSNCQLIDG